MSLNALPRSMLLVAAVAVLAAACAPAAPSPTAPPPKPTEAPKPAATAAPAKPAEAKPAEKPAEKAAPKPTEAPAAKPAAKPAVTLKALSVWEKPISYAQPLVMLIDRIQQKTNGELQIQFNGPEVVPPFETVTAVQRGAFDLAHTSPAFYGTNLPESNGLYFMAGKCDTYRKAGAIEVLDQAHRQKTSTTLLGCSGGGHGFVFITRDPVQNLDYFKGKKIRTTDLYTPIITALGGSAVQVPPAEIYTALERRVVDLIAWPEMGIMERKVHEVLKYMVKPTWLEVRESMVMNVNSLNRLPPHLQKALTETVIEMEPEFDNFFRESARKEQEELQKQGFQIVTLPQAEGEKLLKIVDDALWSKIEKDSPDFATRYRQALAKAKS